MFERFTEGARQVVVLAQEEARLRKQKDIDTEHILLGILRVDEDIAFEVLEEMGIVLGRVRAMVAERKPEGEEVTTGQVPFTVTAKKVLELALREALALGHNYVQSYHILLGLVRLDEGLAVDILKELGADAEKVRNEIIRKLMKEEDRLGVGPKPQSPEDVIRELEKVGDVMNDVDAYFHHQTLMNAKLHLSHPRQAPLVAKHRIATEWLKALIDHLKEEEQNA